MLFVYGFHSPSLALESIEIVYLRFFLFSLLSVSTSGLSVAYVVYETAHTPFCVHNILPGHVKIWNVTIVVLCYTLPI